MQNRESQQKIQSLAHTGPVKAWSVVVTILGDLCQSPDEYISGRVLDALVNRVGITNQTLRVALHRLRRDGWIVSVKDGRTSNYALSKRGWEQTKAVGPIVYGTERPATQNVYLVLGPPHMSAPEFTDALPDDALILVPRVALTTTMSDQLPTDFLINRVSGAQLPDWLFNQIADKKLRDGYADLERNVSDILSSPLPHDLFELTVLRLMTLHHWRRLRLRHGDLPDALLPPDWEGAKARTTVMAALNLLPRPPLMALQDAYEDTAA